MTIGLTEIEASSPLIGTSAVAPTGDWMSFALTEAPWLVRAVLDPSGFPHPLRKLPKILFNNLHMLGRLPAEGMLRVTAPGSDFCVPVDLRNRQILDTAASYRHTGTHEGDVALVLDQFLEGDGVFYDIGANFGFYAMRAALKPGFEGVVHAFEMSWRSFQDLCKLIMAAGLNQRVYGHNVGLSDITGLRPFWDDQHSGRSKVLRSPRSKLRRVSRLDDFAIPPPTLMKVDVEGHEAQVFAGAADTIRRAEPAIVFESWLGSDGGRAPFERLALLGYDFHLPRVRGGLLSLVPLGLDDRAHAGKRINVLATRPRHAAVIDRLVVR